MLFGTDAVPFIREFNGRLRESTRALASELDGQEYPAYSPWMCMRPLMDQGLPRSLMDQTPAKGALVTDREQLEAIDQFISGPGRLIVTGMPVSLADWPVMTDVSDRRRDAVAAFYEGRALLRASEFLSEVYDDLVDFVVPQDRQKPSGFDSPYSRGAVFRTFPAGRGGLLAGFQLAHAMGHQAAIMVLASDALLESDPAAQIRWAVRKDTRNATHAMVSAVALGYMVELYNSLYGLGTRVPVADDHVGGYAEFLPDALSLAVESIASSCQLTRVGNQLVDEMATLADKSRH